MKNTDDKKKGYMGLGVLQAFIGLGALGGGFMLIRDPSGVELGIGLYIRQLRIYLVLFIYIAVFLGCTACKSSMDNFPPGRHHPDFADAKWISVQEKFPVVDSLLFEDDPAPIFRKEFVAKNEIQSATLYISAAGYYRATLNEKRIGKNYLDPAWTNFEKRIYYSEYDLSAEIKKGSFCLGVTLGNGFYNPLPLKMFGRRNLRDELPIGKPAFIASLKLEYTNGKVEEIVSDTSWNYAYGPISRNNVYLGEIYDARKEIKNWGKVGFNDGDWKKAVQVRGPGGQLQKSFFPPIQIRDEKEAVAIYSTQNNKYIVDMGVNFTGLYDIRLQGNFGDTISFRFGERVYEDGTLNPMTTVAGQIKRAGMGGPGSPAIAWQADSYIFGEDTDIWYRPEFTFHTYRYLEISGQDKAPQISDVKGIALNTKVTTKNSFTTSSQLINDIQSATKRTFLSNLIGVQSDCPAREKFGYGGDLNATSEAFIYNFDMQDFYRKTIYDWVDAMEDTSFIDTAPFVGIKYCGISWESAFIITQYNLFLYYKDTAIIRELYDLDVEWMKKAERLHPEGLVDKGLSDHESLEPVPVELTGTTHYLQCARIMKVFASVMGDTEQKKHFEKLADKLTGIILERFWKQPVDDPINKQTLFATLIYHDILPKDEIQSAVDSLLCSLSEPTTHFTTGIFGTKYILEALSKTGHCGTVFDIVNNTIYPGWGHMIDQGASTLWETWKESDNVYSNCHPMFGSVSEWFYKWLVGIRVHPAYPGFEKFIINPTLPEGLSHAYGSYHSPYGEIISNWNNYGVEKQVFEIVIPEGSMAFVKLPVSEHQRISFSQNNSDQKITPERSDKKHCTFELPSGRFTILIQLKDL